MTCPHQSPVDGQLRFACALELYAGRPYPENCRLCMQRGENNAEFRDALWARGETSHPSTGERIAGCCDRADQA